MAARRNTSVALVFALAASATPVSVSAQNARVDAYVKAELAKRQIPAASVALVKNGQAIYAKGFGKAQLELGVPASADTVYQIGSLTKQFTAAAILLLRDEGKLKLDDALSAYVPELPTEWKPVTLRHLLTHTSGIFSYTSLPGFFPKTARRDLTHSELLALVPAKLQFEPGAKFEYSNTGYYLLGMVIEKVTGNTWSEFLAQKVFRPLGMADTRANVWSAVIKHRAGGYTLADGKVANAEYISATSPFSAGSLLSTVNDLAKWATAIEQGKLLGPASHDEMWRPHQLASGRSTGYGFGWSVGKLREHPLIDHGGRIPGFSSYIAFFPAQKLWVIALCNSDTGDADAIARGIATLVEPAFDLPPVKVIADKNPALTNVLQAIMRESATGAVTESRFSPSTRDELVPALKEIGPTVAKQLGKLKRLELISETKQPDGSISRAYRAVFSKQNARLTATFDKNRLIEGLLIEEE